MIISALIINSLKVQILKKTNLNDIRLLIRDAHKLPLEFFSPRFRLSFYQMKISDNYQALKNF